MYASPVILHVVHITCHCEGVCVYIFARILVNGLLGELPNQVTLAGWADRSDRILFETTVDGGRVYPGVNIKSQRGKEEANAQKRERETQKRKRNTK